MTGSGTTAGVETRRPSSSTETALPAVSPQGDDRETAGEVVVGFDRSPESRRALAWALSEAAQRGARCRVVEVLPPMATAFVNSSIEAGWLTVQLDRAADAIRDEVRASGQTSTTDVVVDPQIGPPASTLVRAAESAALLVVGSRGLGRVGQLVLGSVARYAVSHARCPVVVLGPHAGEQ